MDTLLHIAATSAIVLGLLGGWQWVSRTADKGRTEGLDDCPTPHECGHCLMASACHGASHGGDPASPASTLS